ncbi:hypothetical protein CDAR_569971 [Caerostris darwini]|uniref:Ribosomal protein S8 n=1 Tax=Caerostris darwini TaxID=1538125 RepID=A0AAV4S1I7_9ARAC|nr:hypothetical protein CDAR_569971 [Caerostris darwini]
MISVFRKAPQRALTSPKRTNRTLGSHCITSYGCSTYPAPFQLFPQITAGTSLNKAGSAHRQLKKSCSPITIKRRYNPPLIRSRFKHRNSITDLVTDSDISRSPITSCEIPRMLLQTVQLREHLIPLLVVRDKRAAKMADKGEILGVFNEGRIILRREMGPAAPS